jgi:flagellar motility protein MotE (MotC chaperone)
MKDTKSLTLLLLSSVLFLLSIILLCTWGYQYYNQIQQDKTKTPQQAVKETTQPIVADATRDSLLKIYRTTLNSIGTSADSTFSVADSINGTINTNLQQFYTLRDEIAALLQSNTPKTEDLLTARKKILELQKNVEQLKFYNSGIEKENRRLRAMIEQMTRNGNTASAGSTFVTEQPTRTVGARPSIVTGQVVTANLNLSGITAGENELVTNSASSVGKLQGSFLVRNKTSGSNYCDVIVVVTKPTGQVIQKSAWDAGTFETVNGRRIYSLKIRCETANGEAKKIDFFITSDDYPKGNYNMVLYHNGKVIGRASKMLS